VAALLECAAGAPGSALATVAALAALVKATAKKR
jgi:hypothetical protein